MELFSVGSGTIFSPTLPCGELAVAMLPTRLLFFRMNPFAHAFAPSGRKKARPSGDKLIAGGRAEYFCILSGAAY
jgi:hypothetical protein